MTIKQIGGVFGRNPTFNDVVVDDEITVNGSADINGNADISGTLSFPDLSIVGTGNAIYTNTTGAAFFRSSQMLFQNVAGTSGYATINSNGIVMPNGLGIDFSATSDGSGTTTSELLDDYEEGTWTPIAGGSTSQSGQTYGVRGGRYTKIGRTVFVTFDVELTVEGTITGDAVVSGLPFAVPNVGDLSNGMGSLSLVLNTGASYTWQGAAPQNNSSYFNIFVKTAAATSTSSPLGSTFFANGTRIAGGGFYTV
jgi:hypothetical protein